MWRIFFSHPVHLPVFHFKIGYGIVCPCKQQQKECADAPLYCAGVWWYFCWKWMENSVYCCVWPAFGVHIFCVRCDYCIFFLNPFTYIYLYNGEHKKAHIESCCLICVVVHVLIENNVLRIQNCTCASVSVCNCICVVFKYKSNSLSRDGCYCRWCCCCCCCCSGFCCTCAITAKCQQIKQKLICLLTKDPHKQHTMRLLLLSFSRQKARSKFT